MDSAPVSDHQAAGCTPGMTCGVGSGDAGRAATWNVFWAMSRTATTRPDVIETITPHTTHRIPSAVTTAAAAK